MAGRLAPQTSLRFLKNFSIYEGKASDQHLSYFNTFR